MVLSLFHGSTWSDQLCQGHRVYFATLTASIHYSKHYSGLLNVIQTRNKLYDSNLDMENYSSLVDVKLLLKRILDGYWNKLLCKKIIESKVQLAPPTKNVIMAVLTPKSVIQLTAFIAFETGRKLNSVCCILLLVPLQTCIWQKRIGHC